MKSPILKTSSKRILATLSTGIVGGFLLERKKKTKDERFDLKVQNYNELLLIRHTFLLVHVIGKGNKGYVFIQKFSIVT